MFALALGAGETTLLRMTTAYGMFVNGGRQISPIFIDRIQDRTGASVFRRDQRACAQCNAQWSGQRAPNLDDARAQVLDPVTAYQIVSMAEGVVQRGTAQTVNSLGFPLGGKTGTTNDYKDAWFIGFSPDLVVGVWAGFDTPRDRLTSDSMVFLLLNLVGGVLLIVYSAYFSAFANTFINVVWVIIAVPAIFKRMWR